MLPAVHQNRSLGATGEDAVPETSGSCCGAVIGGAVGCEFALSFFGYSGTSWQQNTNMAFIPNLDPGESARATFMYSKDTTIVCTMQM